MGKPIYSMSKAGLCPRALCAERLRMPAETAPEWLEVAAEEGREHEAIVKRKLQQWGYELEDGSCSQCRREGIHVEIELPTLTLLGHMDGRVSRDGSTKVLEIKSMSQFEFDRWMRGGFSEFPEYADQLTCYMTADGRDEALYIVKNRNTGYLDVKHLTSPPSDFSSIAQRLEAVQRNVDRGHIVEAEADFTKLMCKRCLYKHLCTVTPDAPPVTEKQLHQATIDWRVGSYLIKQGTLLVESAKKTFKDHSISAGTPRWRLNDLVIVVSPVKRQHYRKEILLQLFTPEQLAPALEETEYDMVRITDLRQEDGA